MFIIFILFYMFIIITIGMPSNVTLSTHELGDLRHSCEVQCHSKCQGEVQKTCKRCYHNCWAIKGYRLDSGDFNPCS